MNKLAGRISMALAGAFAGLLLTPGARVDAQLSGAHAPTAFGLKAGSQPPPGYYLAPTYFNWDVDQIRTSSGDKISIGGFHVNSLAFFGWYVSPHKMLGATYGAQIVVPWISNAIELPRLGLSRSTSLGFGDLYVMPINLGWHLEQADFVAGLAMYTPTGRYEFLGDDNHGLGMWSFELSGGSTYYFDKKKKWHASALGFYEKHTNKRRADLQVGDVLSIEGGLGGSFLAEQALTAGLAYGAQWKVTSDGGADFPSAVVTGKNRIYTLGPEATYAINKLPWTTSITARYLWDTGARTSFQGRRFIAFVTVGYLNPLPKAPPGPTRDR
jgi:hypothetical protein